MPDDLKAKLIASKLSRKEYLTLRATVRVLRGACVPLDADQENKVKEFQAVVSAYENHHAEKGGPACSS